MKTSQFITRSVKKPTRCVTARAKAVHAHAAFRGKSSANRSKRPGMPFARTHGVTVLGELLLVTSSVVVSLGLSRLALGELFRLVRIDSARSSQDAKRP